jgi:hypothetical protein
MEAQLTQTQTHNVEVKKANLAFVPPFTGISIGPPSQIGIMMLVE